MKEGVGFPGLLTVAFIVLKLTNVISWGWFWVLSPTIFAIGIGILVFGIVLILKAGTRTSTTLRKK